MAKSFTFTFDNDAEALQLRDALCIKWQYENNKLKDDNPAYDDQIPEDPETNPQYINIETKGAFIRRITLNWWFDEATQGEVRAQFQTIQSGYRSISATTSEQ